MFALSPLVRPDRAVLAGNRLLGVEDVSNLAAIVNPVHSQSPCQISAESDSRGRFAFVWHNLTQVGADETVVLKMEVNPALVGGLTVQIGDKFMDLSISSKIAAMKVPVFSCNVCVWLALIPA